MRGNLPDEPDESDDTCSILFRLPEGEKRTRRFLKSDDIKLLYDYIWSIHSEIDWEGSSGFEIVQTMPFKKFEEGTFKSEGLSPSAVVIVREI